MKTREWELPDSELAGSLRSREPVVKNRPIIGSLDWTSFLFLLELDSANNSPLGLSHKTEIITVLYFKGVWKWYDPVGMDWCLGGRNSSKHKDDGFIVVTSVFLSLWNPKESFLQLIQKSSGGVDVLQALSHKMQSPPVYKQEIYMPKMFFRELALGRTHHLSPIIMQYKPLRLSTRDGVQRKNRRWGIW